MRRERKDLFHQFFIGIFPGELLLGIQRFTGLYIRQGLAVRRLSELLDLLAAFLARIQAYTEIDLVQPGYKKPGILYLCDVLKHQYVYLLQYILSKVSILNILICEFILLLVSSRVNFRKSIAVSFLGLFDQFGNILII